GRGRPRPRLDEVGDVRVEAVVRRPPLAGVLIPTIRTDTDQAAGFHRLGVLSGDIQELIGLLAGGALADRPSESGLRYGLTGLRAGAAVEIGHQLAHRSRPTGIQKFMELSLVVPPR